MTHDEIAARGGQFIGELLASDEYTYDGTDELWSGRTWTLFLDNPIGQIVCVDLADVLEAFAGKRVSVTIEPAPWPNVCLPRPTGTSTLLTRPPNPVTAAGT